MLARAPWLVGMGLAVISRLSPTSRLRRRAMVEALSLAFPAINRGDLWVVQIAYEPDCELRLAPGGLRTLGLAESYRGHAGWREFYDAGKEIFLELRLTPEHLIDLGDRWVARLRTSGTGHASGVPTHQTWASVYHMSSRGRIARQDFYWSWEDALAAAGLNGVR
jgi:ketosteroid isomerase-like protein